MRGCMIGAWLAAVLLGPAVANGQVIVHGAGGQQLRGERIEAVGDDSYRLEIYRGMEQRLPKSAVALIEEPPAPPGGPPRSVRRAA